ncbi:hypothetical protein DSO57_1003888 [Entomophthora muscae]|uniref:Uncharacterized protein n=1 Tax=Entomophthora muscae TaxID=34485 RepID=A0ACC2RNB5_9FUNG|nr:hypothetical protein DSO57_1003888 [Entomophthora muscae]
MTTPSSWSLATIQGTLGDWWTGTPQTPNPYGFDLFESHLVSSSAPAPVSTPTQAACQPTNQDGNLDLEQLPATTQPAPLS